MNMIVCSNTSVKDNMELSESSTYMVWTIGAVPIIIIGQIYVSKHVCYAIYFVILSLDQQGSILFLIIFN